MRSSAGLERRRARCGWLALPEGNATGFALFEFCISAKWLELLKQIAPGVTRIAILRDASLAGVGQLLISYGADVRMRIVKRASMPDALTGPDVGH